MKPHLPELRHGILSRESFREWLPTPYIPSPSEEEEEDLEFDVTAKKSTKQGKSGKSGKPTGMKQCTKCKETRPLTEYRPHDTTADGLAAYCKFCQNELNKKYRNRNLPMRLKHHFASRVKDQFRVRGIGLPPRYTEELEKYLGYTMDELFAHLDERVQIEYQVDAKKAILGGWHVDHIKPLSTYDVKEIGDPIFKACWDLDNLRLMPARENFEKGANLDADVNTDG